MKYIVNSIEALPAVAKEIVKSLDKIKIAAFYGSMGVGKTTLIKLICKELNVDDTVNSPSFSIVNEYTTEMGTKIYHFDFYRLKNINELFDIGVEEYFYGDNICLIEWPQIVEDHLPQERINIKISLLENEKRLILANK